MTFCACWHLRSNRERAEGKWEDTFFLLTSCLLWRSPPAPLMSAALCWLEAGSSPGQGCMHSCCPSSATCRVEHGAQQELLPWMGLTDRLVCTTAGKQGWDKGDVYGRSMSFAGCLFHTWKQNNVLLIPESCKPSSVLCTLPAAAWLGDKFS